MFLIVNPKSNRVQSASGAVRMFALGHIYRRTDSSPEMARGGRRARPNFWWISNVAIGQIATHRES